MKNISIYVALFLFSINAIANVSLPSIFSDNMVLQRNSDVVIWGWGSPGEEIKLVASWNSKDTLTTTTDRHAKWKLTLKTTNTKKPVSLDFFGYNHIHLKNVLLGEVWLASGQSNMEWSASAGMIGDKKAIKNATNKNIRFFRVPKKTATTPQLDISASWQVNSPETMQYFSAIAYFFAEKLTTELDVPVGIIGSYWGGTAAEVWIPSEAFDKDATLTASATKLPQEKWGPNEPAYNYNAMIAPLIPFKIAGVLWYQGESNTPNAGSYKNTFSTLIQSWRSKWDDNFPFYYAQIAPYNYGDDNDDGVMIRNTQREVLELPNTGMVATGDVGNLEDIHPRNKKPVGERFANIALKEKYHQFSGEIYGPLVESVHAEKNKIIISFSNSERLYLKNADKQFEVAGENKEFKAVKAKIKNNKVILRSPFKNPAYVRFAWKNAIVPNLYNSADLPASSFETTID
ncbi:sialate O-acetylesterase [Zunongwangia endophytica]|uniref:Sialate O-acetylesterase n=1 Tax=Zunongwangia endophytica TaxID=1808945 RepID=A0ABV8H5K0_9FLAO|nr:sialate O-acetylesterase [Zunongwangia endophytica]MDN3595113.1 sialate O-acetylesterase [Zunongwangia endophytica]